MKNFKYFLVTILALFVSFAAIAGNRLSDEDIKVFKTQAFYSSSFTLDDMTMKWYVYAMDREGEIHLTTVLTDLRTEQTIVVPEPVIGKLTFGENKMMLSMHGNIINTWKFVASGLDSAGKMIFMFEKLPRKYTHVPTYQIFKIAPRP